MTESADSGAPPLPGRAEEIVDELESRVLDIDGLKDAEAEASAEDQTPTVPGAPEPTD